MRSWTILGLEGFSDDWDCSEPHAAADEIRQRQANGELLTDQDIEVVAQKYHCRVKWED